MDRYTAAALGQNLTGIMSDIGQMFDPRVRAQADQQRLTNEGLQLKNTGLGIENEYAPRVFGSQIGLNQARIGTEGAQQGLFGSQTTGVNQQNSARQMMLNNVGQNGSSWDASLPEPMRPLSPAFINYGRQYNVDPRALAAISMHETGGGTSNAYINKRNAMGVSDANGPIAFESPEQSVERMARVLADPNGPYAGKKTLGEIANIYAPVGAANDPRGLNGSWGSGVSRFYQGLGGDPSAPIIGVSDALQQNTQASMGGQGLSNKDLATLANITANSGSADLMTGIAGAFSNDVISNPNSTSDQVNKANSRFHSNPAMATLQERVAMENAIGAPALENARAIKAADSQVDLIKSMYGLGGGSSRGDGSMLGIPKTAPQSFNDMLKVNEEAQAASFQTFGVPLDENGVPSDDTYAPTRRVWAQSYANARSAGMSPIEATAAANVHHFGTDQPEISSEDTFRMGFGKDPSIPSIKNVKPIPGPAAQAFGAMDPNQIGQILGGIPSLYGFQAQTPEIANSGVPATGVEAPAQPRNEVPPMLARPAEQPAKPARAIDQFKPREGSTEKKAREKKEKEIAALEAELAADVESLQSGEVVVPQTFSAYGSGATFGVPKSVKLSNDAYNSTLARLKKTEAKLEKLKDSSNQSGQGAMRIGRFEVSE